MCRFDRSCPARTVHGTSLPIDCRKRDAKIARIGPSPNRCTSYCGPGNRDGRTQIEGSPDLPSIAIHVEGMPEDAGRAVQGAGEAGDWPKSPRPRLRASGGARGAGGYWPSGRIQATEGQNGLLRQFARQVDKALRPVVTGSGLPLVLAAAEPLASTYRSVNSYPHLAAAPHITERPQSLRVFGCLP